ncbi:RNA-directed DNA polymerase, eukaryota [Tanacetum coccineum]
MMLAKVEAELNGGGGKISYVWQRDLVVLKERARGIVCVEDGTVFSSQNGSGDGSGLKEKNQNQVLSNEAAKVGIIPSDIGNGGEAYGFVTSNVGNSPSLAGNVLNLISFATKIKGNTSRKTINFGPLFMPTGNGVDVHVPKESFGSKEGMEAILETYTWLIRNVSLILKQWTPDANIIKEVVCDIPVWVKFHDVPIIAFIEDGLSVVTTKLAMIELEADVDLRDTIVVVVPTFSGEGFTTSTIHVEHEWAPPRCSECKVYVHFLDGCPKKIISNISKNFKMPLQPARGHPVQTANKATTPILNSFDALSTLVDEEEEGGNQNPSTNATLVVAKINELERQMLDRKLVLVDEHGKPLERKVTNKASDSKPSTSTGDQLEESDKDEVELPNDETSRYMSSTGG